MYIFKKLDLVEFIRLSLYGFWFLCHTWALPTQLENMGIFPPRTIKDLLFIHDRSLGCTFNEKVRKLSEKNKINPWQVVEVGGRWKNFVFKISFFGFSCLCFKTTEEPFGLFLYFLDFDFKWLVTNVSKVSGNFKLRVVYSAHLQLCLVDLAALLGLMLQKHFFLTLGHKYT